jgi:hypothetical protein
VVSRSTLVSVDMGVFGDGCVTFCGTSRKNTINSLGKKKSTLLCEIQKPNNRLDQ